MRRRRREGTLGRLTVLRRPLLLWLIGIGLILSPIYYYFEGALSAGLAWTDPRAVIASIPYVKLGGALFGPPVGVLVLRVRRSSWYAILGYASYTVMTNVALLAAGRVRPTLFAIFVPTGLLCILYFARRTIMSPFFNPRLRGWESDRVRFRAPAEIELDGETLSGKLWDVSRTGFYVELEHDIPRGTAFTCRVEIEPGKPLELLARSVWSSPGKDDRPRGVGAELDVPSAAAVAASLGRVLRRAAPRLPFKLHVDIAGHDEIACDTFDVSRLGCFLVSDLAVTVGQRLEMTLHLPEPVAVAGEVVRVSAGSPRGFGVRFERTPLRLRAALRHFHAAQAEAGLPTGSDA